MVHCPCQSRRHRTALSPGQARVEPETSAVWKRELMNEGEKPSATSPPILNRSRIWTHSRKRHPLTNPALEPLGPNWFTVSIAPENNFLWIFHVNLCSTADHGLYKEEVTLSEEELDMCKRESFPLTGSYIYEPPDMQVRQVMPFILVCRCQCGLC